MPESDFQVFKVRRFCGNESRVKTPENVTLKPRAGREEMQIPWRCGKRTSKAIGTGEELAIVAFT